MRASWRSAPSCRPPARTPSTHIPKTSSVVVQNQPPSMRTSCQKPKLLMSAKTLGRAPCLCCAAPLVSLTRRFMPSISRVQPELSRYLVAALVPFPEDAIKEATPELHAMTDALALKAGCPLGWAFLLFLPGLATACSTARLVINEFLLVPPLLWLGLYLDSGANKSGIMTAIADIISGFEKDLLERALAEARAAPAKNDADDEDEPAQPAQDEAAHATRRKVQLRKKWPQSTPTSRSFTATRAAFLPSACRWLRTVTVLLGCTTKAASCCVRWRTGKVQGPILQPCQSCLTARPGNVPSSRTRIFSS